MGNNETGRLLIYQHAIGWPSLDSATRADLIGLSAALQRRFPDQPVEPADPEWLRQAVRAPLPLPPKSPPPELNEQELRESLSIEFEQLPLQIPEAHEYIYLVLGWLGGTVSKQITEQAIKAAADLVREWMRERRNKNNDHFAQTAYILGPDGKVLQEVEVPAARGRASRRRRASGRRREPQSRKPQR